MRRDFERPPYSGRLQAWKNCDGNGEGSAVTLVAAPEDRECVVLLQVVMYGKSDAEVGQHILDSFEVDCGRIREGGPISSTVSASASASPTASASASAAPGLICDKYGCMTPEEVAQQKQMGEGWWPGSGMERPQPNNCAATKTKADGC
jgi:hypothetical protein